MLHCHHSAVKHTKLSFVLFITGNQFFLEIVAAFDFSLPFQPVLTDVCMDTSCLLLNTPQPCPALQRLTLTGDWALILLPMTVRHIRQTLNLPRG